MPRPFRPGLRLRRYWKAPAALVVLVIALLAVGSGIRVRPMVAAGGQLPPRGPITNITNDIDLFDDDIVHSVAVTIDPEDRQRMLDAYAEDGQKIVVPAEVTIDGVEIPGAGIRLKGNSSLWGVGGGGFEDAFAEGEDGDFGGDFAEIDKLFNECLAERGVDVSFGPPGGGPDGGGGVVVLGGPPGGFEGGVPVDGFEAVGDVDFSFPETLHPESGDAFAAPYLLVFNHTDLAQRYQGLAQVALRTDGNGTILAEPVTTAAYAAAGLAAPRTSLTGLSINGGEERLYGLATVLDQEYVDRHFGGADGVLYKATSLQSQDFSYEGEDPTDYEGFAQETNTKRFDKAPLIDLLRFVNESSDETFATDLAKHVDVTALARLLAINNILVNTDSLGTGPGGNYYLFWNAETGRFTPLGWDFNYSLGGLDGFNASAATDPLETSAFGSDVFVGADGDLPEGVVVVGGPEGATADVGGTDGDPFAYCDNLVNDQLGGPVIFGGPPGAAVEGAEPGDFDDEAFFNQQHRLVERFMATPEFRELYNQEYRKVHDATFGSGMVAEALQHRIDLVTAALEARPDLAAANRLETQNSSLTTFVQDRANYLAANLPGGA